MTFCFRSVLVGALLLFAGADLAHAQIYRWEDSSGGVHYSNRVDRTPEGAEVVSPPPLGSSRVFRRGRPGASRVTIPRPKREERPAVIERRGAGRSNPGQAMARAIERRVAAAGQRDSFTLFVDGRLVTARRDAVLEVSGAGDDEDWNVLGMGALADPSLPPRRDLSLDVYEVAGRNGGNGGVCGDFRRAFATVGVAVSRDHQVGRSFREIAEHFVRIAADDYRVRDAEKAEPLVVNAAADEVTVTRRRGGSVRVRGGDVPSVTTLSAGPMEAQLPPWLVDGHVAQLEALSEDTEGYVRALAIALEEIDVAARDLGCW